MDQSLAYSDPLGEPHTRYGSLPPSHTLETPHTAGGDTASDVSLSAALLALVGEPEGSARSVPRRDDELHRSAAAQRTALPADIKAKAAKFCAFHNAKVEDERAADAASRAADTSVNAPLVPDTNFAVAFLAAIDPPGRHDLLAINSYLPAKHPAKIEAATFFPADQEKMRAWIDARQGKKNLYVSVNRAKADAPLNARLSKSDVSIIRAVVADIDASKVLHGDPSGENFYRERDRLLQVVAKSLSNDKQCPPTFVVDSGGGLQAWWVLAPSLPATPDNIELVEGIGRTIQRRYNGDSVFDVARIMRLPGTINVLSPDKREQGREPAVAKVLDENCAGAMYLIEALKSWAPPTAEAAKREDDKAGWDKIDMAAVEEVVTYEDLPASLRDKFERYCEDRPFVGALWRGEEVPGDGTPSVRVYTLAGQLRMAGTFTITEFAQLVWVWEFRSERHADEFERYVSRAWNRNTAPLGGEGLDPIELPDTAEAASYARDHDQAAHTVAPSKAVAAPAAAQIPATKSREPLPPEPSHGKARRAPIVASPLRRFDPATIPPVPWVVGGLAARRAISTLTGPGGISKSTWTLQLAVAIAAGRSDICGYDIAKRDRVWVWSQEDDISQMELRLAAIMQAFNVTRDDLLDERGQDMVYLNSGLGRGKRLTLVQRVGDTLRESEQLAEMLAQAKAIRPGAIVLDPLISLHQAGENDNVQMRAVFDCISQIAVAADSAVLIVSHTGKPDKGSSKGFAGDSYASRGASAQPDAARVAVTFMGLSEDDAKKGWRLPAGKSHLDYVRIDDSKSNLGKKRRTPRLFAREDVLVAGFTGDSMEVLRPAVLETRVKTGAPVMAHNIARAISEHMAIDSPHTVAALLPHLPDAEAQALAEQKNRAKVLDAVFDGGGVTECLTDFGTLRRAKGTGNRGTLLTLSAAPHHLKTVNEAELSA